ncbi:hypothetical protein K438DRAFT_1847504 [Mycena galopus ATCC 62051]|nr:hypothetical protein K438DRAFT_1847504 [Mycena galopus ATCC 62051]
MQLIQLLEAPPGGSLLTVLSSFVFIMLVILALELIGWFLFLGLLITILAYLLLIILFGPASNLAAGCASKIPNSATKFRGVVGRLFGDRCMGIATCRL